MGLTSRIKGMAKSFTKTDQKIADYFLHQSETALSYSVAELGSVTETSPAAIIRFVKKLRYESLSELRCDLAVELSKTDPGEKTLLLQKQDTWQTIAEKLVYLSQQVAQNTKELLKPRSLENAILHMQSAESIYLYGIGASAIVAQDLASKLIRIGKKCIFQSDSSIQLSTSVHTKPEDVVLGFSYSGQTREVLTAIRQAKHNGTYCICITSTQPNPLHTLADAVLQVPHVEDEIRIGAIGSRYGMLFLSDLLFLCTAQDQYDFVEQALLNTRKVIQSLH